jgi:hypothetical protein
MQKPITIAALTGAALLAAVASGAAAGARSATNGPAKVSPLLTAPNPHYVSPRQSVAEGNLRRTARNPNCRWGGHPCH